MDREVEPEDASWVKTRHERAKDPWGDYIAHAEDAEYVYTGQVDVPSDLSESDLEVAEPAQGGIIIDKMDEMIGIRSAKSYEVAHRNTQSDAALADNLERFCHTYDAELANAIQLDPMRAGVKKLLIRGRAGWQTLYQGSRSMPKIRPRLLDALEYFPVYGEDGIGWFTTEKQMTRWQLEDYFDGLDDDVEGLQIKDTGLNFLTVDEKGRDYDINDLFTVVEYWDEKWCAWVVDNTLVSKYRHDWGMTLREARLRATEGMANLRYSCESFLGRVISPIKLRYALLSKMANAIQAMYYGLLYATNLDDELIIFNPQTVVGEVTKLAHGTTVQHLQPRPNDQAIQIFLSALDAEISKGTLSEVAFVTNIPESSGFNTSQILSIMKDSIADVVDQVERVWGCVWSDILYLHEEYAPMDGWEYPVLLSSRWKGQNLKAEDIDGHYRVKVTVRPALPQDVVQKATIINQLVKRDPATGMLTMGPKTAFDAVKMDEVIEDMTAWEDEIEMDYLINNDEQAKALHIANLRAKHFPELREMEKDVQKMAKKEEKRQLADAARLIEKRMSEDIIIPAEVLADSQKLRQLAALVEQGMLPQQALDTVMQGMPLGAPGAEVTGGQQPAQPISPEVQRLMEQMKGPDGFTGYEGMNPMAAPAAIQGALPRRVTDQNRLQVENTEEQVRRGARPAPK